MHCPLKSCLDAQNRAATPITARTKPITHLAPTGTPRTSRRHRLTRSPESLANDALSTGVGKLRKLLEGFPRRSRQHDLRRPGRVGEQEAVIGNRHQAAPEAKKATDLEHREEDAVIAANDEVVDRTDPLAAVIDHRATHQLAHAVTEIGRASCRERV